jgi:hypothetical protein
MDCGSERQHELNERIAGEIAMMAREAAVNLKDIVSFDVQQVCFEAQDEIL